MAAAGESTGVMAAMDLVYVPLRGARSMRKGIRLACPVCATASAQMHATKLRPKGISGMACLSRGPH